MDLTACPRCKTWAARGCTLCFDRQVLSPWPPKHVPVTMAVEYALRYSKTPTSVATNDFKLMRQLRSKYTALNKAAVVPCPVVGEDQDSDRHPDGDCYLCRGAAVLPATMAVEFRLLGLHEETTSDAETKEWVRQTYVLQRRYGITPWRQLVDGLRIANLLDDLTAKELLEELDHGEA